MKKIILILVLIIVFSCQSKKTIYSSKVRTELGININAQVSKIDSIANYYLVYINSDKGDFKIVSDKHKAYPYNGVKVRIGKKYKFRIEEKLTDRFIYIDNKKISMANMDHVRRCMYFNNTEICTESFFNLAIANNLKGLYINKE